MVRTATHWPSERPHPDPIRILGISASIALNIAALALLMRPPEFAPPATPADTPAITIIPPLVKKLIVPTPTPAAKQHTQTTHVVSQQVQRQQTVILPSTPMSTDPIVTQTVDKGDHVDIAPPQPIETSLIPIASPAPTYPPIALRDGITGTVELELLVGIDGRVAEVHVTRSSGNRQLDNAAREQVLRNWRFQPAMRDGVAVQALGRVPIVFTLDGR